MYKDRVEEKRKKIAMAKKPKKQFGERSLKKTNIPYEESRKCQKLTAFTEEDDV